MYNDSLARFITKSSDWSDLKRGSEVFKHASELFKEIFHVDSGFFVYKKRLPSESSSQFKIFRPWGIFEGSIGPLQFLLGGNISKLESLLQLETEKWLDIKDVSTEENSNIQQLGIWKMFSRGELIGGIVLARLNLKTKDDENVIAVCAKQVALILDMLLAWRATDEMSRYDLLTGVLNRKGIFDLYKTSIANAERDRKTIMIAVIDIDNFKQINDCHGHPEGDRILLEVANTLKNNIYSGDLAGRFGGDEFVLIMQTQNQNSQSIEQRIEELIPCSKGYTISAGTAIWNEDGHDWDTCYKFADKRLYERKAQKKKHVEENKRIF